MMNQQERQQAYEDEINLYDYWKVIAKRKKLIIGLFIISIISAVAISLLMPKIYRGEAALRLPTKELTTKELTTKELFDIIGKLDRGKIEVIFPKTYHLVSDIKLNTIEGSTDKFRVIIEAKKTEDFPAILSEFVEHINNNPLIKRHVEDAKERLLKQSEELLLNIKTSRELAKTYETLLKKGVLIPIGFNPVDLYKGISNLEIEKILVQQAIRNLNKGVEIVRQLYVSENPVKPKTTINIALAGIVSLFAGIFIAFFVEYINKIKRQKETG